MADAATKDFLKSLLAYAAQRDLAVENLCELSGLNLAEVMADHPISITQHQLSALWRNLIHLSNDEYFGLHFGESLQLAALGVVGELIKSSATIGEAVTTAASLIHLITPLFGMTVIKEACTFSIQFTAEDKEWSTNVTATQTLDLLMALVIHELDALVLQKVRPLQVMTSRPLTNIKEYERVLRCKPQANAESTTLSFDISYWNMPIITANYQLQSFLKTEISSQIPVKSEKLKDKVRIFLMSNVLMGIVSLDKLAANFNTHPRTIQRRLKDENSSYQKIAEDVRQHLAMQALKQNVYASKEIAYMLGYNEPSAFSRAFKRWTGLSPDAYRSVSKN